MAHHILAVVKVFEPGEMVDTDEGLALVQQTGESPKYAVISPVQFVLPRMTTVQRNALVNPITGTMIHNTTTDSINHYTLGGWITL